MNVKKMIIVVIIVIIILIIGITIMIKYLNNKSEDIQEENGDPGLVVDYESKTTEEVTDFVKYYTVINCVDTYIDTLNVNNTSYYGMDENDNYTIIFSN